MAYKHRLDHRPFLVPAGKKIRLKDFATDYSAGFDDKDDGKEALKQDVLALAEVQDILWASKEYAVIVILQALDAAGKDGTIKHVMSGVNPQGVTVHSFRAPSEEERQRHFLWRPARVLPAYGMIAIFNRSYYEEVLVVRVHPEFLEKQWLPPKFRAKQDKRLWQSRFDDINTFEKELADKNICVLKFFLHISREEQRRRLLARLNAPEKNWKFSPADIRERAYWNQYQEAYEEMLSATSTKSAPWHVIPADKKWFARACVADIIAAKLESLKLSYPTLTEQQLQELIAAAHDLENEGKPESVAPKTGSASAARRKK
jgi:PPK2 family polyphosphate:nucleotide phosphotransferase